MSKQYVIEKRDQVTIADQVLCVCLPPDAKHKYGLLVPVVVTGPGNASLVLVEVEAIGIGQRAAHARGPDWNDNGEGEDAILERELDRTRSVPPMSPAPDFTK